MTNLDMAQKDLKQAMVTAVDEYGLGAALAATGAIFCAGVGSLRACIGEESTNDYLDAVVASLARYGIKASFVMMEGECSQWM